MALAKSSGYDIRVSSVPSTLTDSQVRSYFEDIAQSTIVQYLCEETHLVMSFGDPKGRENILKIDRHIIDGQKVIVTPGTRPIYRRCVAEIDPVYVLLLDKMAIQKRLNCPTNSSSVDCGTEVSGSVEDLLKYRALLWEMLHVVNTDLSTNSVDHMEKCGDRSDFLPGCTETEIRVLSIPEELSIDELKAYIDDVSECSVENLFVYYPYNQDPEEAMIVLPDEEASDKVMDKNVHNIGGLDVIFVQRFLPMYQKCVAEIEPLFVTLAGEEDICDYLAKSKIEVQRSDHCLKISGNLSSILDTRSVLHDFLVACEFEDYIEKPDVRPKNCLDLSNSQPSTSQQNKFSQDLQSQIVKTTDAPREKRKCMHISASSSAMDSPNPDLPMEVDDEPARSHSDHNGQLSLHPALWHFLSSSKDFNDIKKSHDVCITFHETDCQNGTIIIESDNPKKVSLVERLVSAVISELKRRHSTRVVNTRVGGVTLSMAIAETEAMFHNVHIRRQSKRVFFSGLKRHVEKAIATFRELTEG